MASRRNIAAVPPQPWLMTIVGSFSLWTCFGANTSAAMRVPSLMMSAVRKDISSGTLNAGLGPVWESVRFGLPSPPLRGRGVGGEGGFAEESSAPSPPPLSPEAGARGLSDRSGSPKHWTLPVYFLGKKHSNSLGVNSVLPPPT